MKTLIVVDMQNDFIDGALGTKEAVAIVPKVAQKLAKARAEGAQIIFTRDTHQRNYLETQEGKHLPVEHCIQGSKGWEITEDLTVQANDLVINKITFGHTWSKNDILGDQIELVGLCTDICVISNALALKAVYPELPILVDASCCAGVSPQTHKNALEAMKICQITILDE